MSDLEHSNNLENPIRWEGGQQQLVPEKSERDSSPFGSAAHVGFDAKHQDWGHSEPHSDGNFEVEMPLMRRCCCLMQNVEHSLDEAEEVSSVGDCLRLRPPQAPKGSLSESYDCLSSNTCL